MPDWSKTLDCLPFTAGNRLLRATGTNPATLRLSEDRSVLHILGKVVDEIHVRANSYAVNRLWIPAKESSGSVQGGSKGAPGRNLNPSLANGEWTFNEDGEPDFDSPPPLIRIQPSLPRQWIQECFEIAFPDAGNILEVLKLNSVEVQAFIFTLCCLEKNKKVPLMRHTLGTNSPIARFKRILRDCLELTIKEKRDSLISNRETMNMSSVLQEGLFWAHNRRFCKTVGDRIGWVPLASQVGDIIVVLYGGNVPYVLRRQPAGYYQLLGECYIWGLMHGEALQGTANPDQEFEMH